MAKKADELDDLIDALEQVRTALQAAPARQSLVDDRYWAWLAGPRASALALIEKVLGA
jgi:hypothetical protein